MADLNYIESGYFTPEQGYYVYTADASLASESAASLTAEAGVIKGVSSDMTATFTQEILATRTKDTDLFAFTDAAIAVQIDVLREYNIAADCHFDIATDGRRFRDVAAAEESIFSFDVVNSRSRAFNIETQAAFSLAAEATELRLAQEGEANLEVISEITIFATSNILAIADIAATSIIDCSVERLRETTIEFTSISSASSEALRTRDYQSNIASLLELSAIISHIEGADIVVNGFASLTSTVSVTRGVSSTINSAFTQSTTGRRLTEYWVNTYDSTGVNTFGERGIFVDNLGYVYSTSYGANNEAVLIKSDRYGTVIYSKSFGYNIGGIVDTHQTSDDNLIIASNRTLLKFNTSTGSVIWQKTYTSGFDIDKITVDASNNIYAIGSASSLAVIKYDSSGNIVYKKRLTGLSVNIRTKPVVDSQNNIIIASYNTALTNSFVVKLNSSGTSILWQKRINEATHIFGLVIDQSDNVYYSYQAAARARITKVNSSGVHQWTSVIGSVDVIALSIDKNKQRLYAVGSYYNDVFSYDYSGNVIWKKRLSLTGVSQFSFTETSYIDLYASGLYVNAYSNPSGSLYDRAVVKLPLDGSGTALSPLTYINSPQTVIPATYDINSTVIVIGTDPTYTTTTNESVPITNVTYTNTFYEIEGGKSVVQGFITIAATTAVSANVEMRKGSPAALASQFTQTATAEVIADGTISLTAAATLSASGQRTAEIILSAFTDAALNADVGRITQIDAAFATQADVSATVARLATFSGDLQTTVILATDSNRIRDNSAEFEAIATELAAVVKTSGNMADLTAEFQQSTIATVIASANINAAIESNAAIDADVITGIELTLTSTASVNASFDRTRDINSALAVVFNEEVIARKDVEANSSLSSEFTLSIDYAGSTVGANIVANGFASLAITANINKPFDASLSTAFTQTTETFDSLAKTAQAALDTDTNLDVQGSRIRSTEIALTAFASELSIGTKTTRFTASLTSAFITAIIGDKIAGTSSVIGSSSSVNAQATRIQQGVINLSTNADMSASGRLSSDAAADLTVESSLSALAVKNSEIILTAFSNAGMTTSARRIRGNIVAAASQASVVVTYTKVVRTSVQMQAFASEVVAAGTKIGGIANFTVVSTMTITASVLHLNEYVWIIPSESREFKIAGESRERIIAGESREFTIRR